MWFLMISAAWSNLKDRLFFTVEDVADLQGIAITSAHVLCSRYVRRGIFIRVKKNFYVLERNWTHYGIREIFQDQQSLADAFLHLLYDSPFLLWGYHPGSTELV